MKLFTFAIASIVDANTGHGLPKTVGSNHFEAAKSRGSEIRSRSILDLLASTAARIQELTESFRAGARERRDLAELMRLNDRMLRDIGIKRGDLQAVKMGSLSLHELHRQHESARRARLQEVDDRPQVGRVDINTEAANAQHFDDQKCA